MTDEEREEQKAYRAVQADRRARAVLARRDPQRTLYSNAGDRRLRQARAAAVMRHIR